MSTLVETFHVTGRKNRDALNLHPLPPLNQLRLLALDLGGGADGLPPVDDRELQRDWSLIEKWLGSEKPAKALPLETWKRVPLLLWWKIGERPVIEHPRLRQGLLWAASMSVPRVNWIEALAEAYTRAKEVPEESHRWIGTTLREWCNAESHARLEVWLERDLKWKIWSPNEFPLAFSRSLQTGQGISLFATLEAAGLASAVDQSSDLSRKAFISHLALAVGASQGYGASHLDCVCEWRNLIVVGDAGWTDNLANAAINGLLEPWATFNPPDVEFQKRIKQTLENWFGPVPERWTGHWAEASGLSREILARWKVLDVMEEYFKLVEAYARQLANDGAGIMQQHWQYRRPFWLAYYKKGAVTGARALIGPGLMAWAGPRTLKKSFGKAIAGLTAQTYHHCGLLLEINGMVVVDLSHSGKAYFFLPSNRSMPSTKASNYSRNSLDGTADEALTHNGSITYAWQAKFENYIHHHTSVRVRPTEYRLPYDFPPPD
jgi:hypothetical protein